MSTRHAAKIRRSATAALAAAALALSLSACGGDGGGEKGADDGKQKVESAASTGGSQGEKKPQADETPNQPEAPQTLATINGSNGFQFTLTGAARDSGGFLTISGTLKNSSGKSLPPPVEWNGEEVEVKRTGRSFAGMTLIDKAAKKRYYVLRDTEGFPLTTTGLSTLDPGEAVDFFAQFPAPPETTTEVDVQIPLMPTATIELPR
jgi:hypothetical protein